MIIMFVTPRLQRRIFIYSYVFRKLGILSEQEYNRITDSITDQLHEQH
jgi:hypothetical protein